MNFMDFGRQNGNCRVMENGFVLWEISPEERAEPVLLENGDTDMVVHILMLEGLMKVSWRGTPYLLAKDSFSDFIDGTSLEVHEVLEGSKAYVLLFSQSFVKLMLKESLPFPSSYLLRIKTWPVSAMLSETARIFQRRIEAIAEAFTYAPAHVREQMVRCALWMLIMEVANEHIKRENRYAEHVEAGRKGSLFKQFMKLLFAHVREERSVNWYASQLCVTSQYLNRVVKSNSRRTIHDHISAALTGAVIHELENTELPLSRIAENFNFPDQAALTKFFKRQTGKTPSEYRRDHVLSVPV